jgi:hypothetical protein
MTKVQICIFAWAILGLIAAAILLRFGERGMNGTEKIAIDVVLA